MKSQKVNITDIAKKTGLSATTVSRVLSGKAEKYRIGIESQEKVKAAASELHYIPNHFASNLRSGKSSTIALIVPTLNNPFFAGIASEINSEVRKHSYITIIGDSDENIEIEKIEIQQLISRNIEGLIIAPTGSQAEHIQELYDAGLPIICFDRYFENLSIPFVSTDNFDGAYTAAKYLIENGHHKITCIQGLQYSMPNKMRINGFINAMKQYNLTDYNIVGDDFTVQNGYLETKLLLQQNERPSAIFTLSNTIAMGCLKALKEENIRVPDDISIITFDEHPYQDYLLTPLTCISQPVSDISKIVIKFLFAKINNIDMKTNQVLLKPTLKIKESVKRIDSVSKSVSVR